MSILTSDLTAASLISQFELGQTEVLKPRPEDIEGLCVVDSLSSFRAETMSFRLLTIPKRSITPVHVHPNEKEKGYIRFKDPSIVADVKVFVYKNGTWSVFFIDADSGPVIIPAKTPHAVFTSAHARIMVITSNRDPETEWEGGKPTSKT